MATMRIASWNINSVRARLGLVTEFLARHDPDVLCLQETKVVDDLFPLDALAAAGYPHIVVAGQKMHHGVAIISRVPMAGVVRHDWQDNGEARHIGVTLPGGVRLENVYVPAGGDVADPVVNPKFAQKLAFLDRMTHWSATVSAPTVLTGDFNIAPRECDVWNHRALLDVVSHTPVEVAALAALRDAGDWIDLGARHLAPGERCWTWWSYRARDYAASDRGRRLDHMWVTPDLAAKVSGHAIAEQCRGWDRPSDHVPVITDFDW